MLLAGLVIWSYCFGVLLTSIILSKLEMTDDDTPYLCLGWPVLAFVGIVCLVGVGILMVFDLFQTKEPYD